MEDHDPAASAQLIALYEADQQSDYLLEKARLSPELMTAQDRTDLQAYLQVYTYQQQQVYGTAVAQQLLKGLLTEGPGYRTYPNYFAASEEAQKQEAVVNREHSDSLLGNIAWLRGKGPDEKIYDKAKQYITINNHTQGEANIGQAALEFLGGLPGRAIQVLSLSAMGGGSVVGGLKAIDDKNGWALAGNAVTGALAAVGLGTTAKGLVTAGGKGVSAGGDVVERAYYPSDLVGPATGTKATGTAVDDTIKALPAPKQIDASWGANTYKKGGLMTGIEHVFYRHGPDSGFVNIGKFSEGTSIKDVSNYVDSALRYGKVTPNGPGGYIVEYNAGKVIGTNISGAPTSTIKINVRDGVIHTAFPY
ncbi:hypothetical protein [Pseudomonas sp. KNUC1026]|uniref:hypothetical protein n=1 Tax=Pseudomonas sp. KNUC1026 TaxID=2893890 RepID=UPI001F1F0C36|nr:hypothetical protein [Pseudomonas sp. KNUC1026]UFH49284.1 hypothetical protein LN139_20825 [Pseudomonas sp. KNUC1026]